MSYKHGVQVQQRKRVQCRWTLPLRRPAAFWDTVMLRFDVREEHTAMQHYNDSQLVWLYCVLCSTLPKKKKHLICKRKIYAKPNSTFNGVKVKGEQETGAQISIWNNIVHVLFPMRTGTDEGINSFATVTSLAAMMIVMCVSVWDEGRTLENLWEHEENCRSSTLKSSSFVSSSSVSRWWYLSERAGNDETFRFQNGFYCIQLLKCQGDLSRRKNTFMHRSYWFMLWPFH